MLLNNKKNLTIVFVASALLLGITACVPHLSKEQCLNLDPHREGYRVGISGQIYGPQLTKLISDCKRQKILINQESYRTGWEEGVRQFCQPQTGFNLGVIGKMYSNICPSDLKPGMAKAWRRGLRHYCVPSTGYELGSSGAALPRFCAPDQANRFKAAFLDGRKVYHVKRSINAISGQIDDLESNINSERSNIKKIDEDLSSSSLSFHDLSKDEKREKRRSQRASYSKITDYQYKIHRISNDLNIMRWKLEHLEERYREKYDL